MTKWQLGYLHKYWLFTMAMLHVYFHLLKRVYIHSFIHSWLQVSCAAAIVHWNHFFRLYQHNKTLGSKGKFKQVSNYCKGVLEAAKPPYANKTRVYHFTETCLSELLANY